MNINITFNYNEIEILIESLNNLEVIANQFLLNKSKENILLKLEYAKLKICQEGNQNEQD